MPTIAFAPFDPEVEVEDLAAFLASNTFPFHGRPSVTEQGARALVLEGRYWSDGSAGYWVLADGVRVGIAVLEDLEDIADGGAPLFDLRLDQQYRGRGLGEPVLRALTSMVFRTYPTLRRFEGQTRDDNVAMRRVFVRAGWVKEAHYREAWPVEGFEPKASIAYGILRRDWESGTTTPVPWDDLPA
ncbi:GNAT family N-acetyltransferase [Propionicimonas sp.]|uniref:GNAT family N-acetyltransferase n=1 Tax=Propionicimonas sp. TaxID=1955623 RepID=UPI0039E3F8D7